MPLLRLMPLLAVAFLALAACSTATSPNSTRNVNATVRYLNLEGGFYALVGDDSVTYEPRNLAREFQRDGLRVSVRLEIQRDMVSFRQVGPIVDIVAISPL